MLFGISIVSIIVGLLLIRLCMPEANAEKVLGIKALLIGVLIFSLGVSGVIYEGTSPTTDIFIEEITTSAPENLGFPFDSPVVVKIKVFENRSTRPFTSNTYRKYYISDVQFLYK